MILTNQDSRAGSAAWTGAVRSNWDDAQNWNPQTVPDGVDDVATFGISDHTVLIPGFELNGMVFEQDASEYTFNGYSGEVSWLTGAGITNNSGKLQSFEVQ